MDKLIKEIEKELKDARERSRTDNNYDTAYANGLEFALMRFELLKMQKPIVNEFDKKTGKEEKKELTAEAVVKELQKDLISKLSKVQELVIKKMLSGEKIAFEVYSLTKSSYLRYGEIQSIRHENAEVRIDSFYDSRVYDKLNIDFYKKQHKVIDYWIKLLTEKN